MSDKYRFDNRTRAEFERDIKEGNLLEKQLLIRWLQRLGDGRKYRETGCGNDGEFLTADKVSLAADFWVDGYGSVEVKFAKPLAQTFHLKVDQIDYYIRNNASILMVIGVETATPKYSLMTLDDLHYIAEEAEVVNCRQFGNKQAYRVPSSWLSWKDL